MGLPFIPQVTYKYVALVGTPYKDMLVAVEWKVTDMTGKTGECAAIQRGTACSDNMELNFTEIL
jgi:hypothetical protein